MSRVIYYFAMSLDGFIADRNGALDSWLPVPEVNADGRPELDEYGYSEFYARIAAVIMGRATYEFLLHESIPWPYAGRRAFVYASQDVPRKNDADFETTTEDPAALVERLRAEISGDIWLLGGGRLAGAFAERDLIDEYHIATMPALLGSGTPTIAPHIKPGGVQRVKLLSHTVTARGELLAQYAVLR